MKISVPVFKGEVPRIAPRALPNECAQAAVNARLLSNNLEGWKNFQDTAALCKPAPINTIFLLDDTYWLHWTDSELASGAVEVDVARSVDGTDSTGRVFITGLDIPRYTTVALATGGSGCMPHETRPLGVPNPDTAPTVSATIGGNGATISADDPANEYSQWTAVGLISSVTQIRYAVEYAALGNPAPSYQMVVQASPTVAYMIRDYGLANSAIIEVTTDFYIAAVTTAGDYSVGIRAATTDGGSGPAATIARGGGSTSLIVSQATGFDTGATVASVAMSNLSTLTWYKLRLRLERQSNGQFSSVASVLDNAGTTVLATVSGTTSAGGGHVMLASANNSAVAAGPTSLLFDNIAVDASGAFNDPADDFTTAYVYTWVNDLGEESGPSPASATLLKDDGTTVTVTTPTTPGSGYDYYIVAKRIYRAITTAVGTSYYFLGEQLISYATFEDTITNANAVLNETLTTELYALPPTDLRGIMALPNSIYAGFSGKNLCLTPPGQPHAWPVEYRYAIDTDVVALGKIDAQVVILGATFPYLAGGNDPAVFSMVNTEVPQGCESKRSIAYVKGRGVCYASPDGIVAVAGIGQVQLLTEGIFTREEWQALRPSSIIARAHDNRYLGFYTTAAGVKGGFMLEFGEQGFGKVTLSFHVTALYDDQANDKLFMVLDENVVPEVGSGTAANQVVPNGTTVYAFDQYAGGSPTVSALLPYRWRSKKYLQPWLNSYRYACVRAESYANTWFLLYADGTLVHAQAVTDGQAFVLPDTDAMFVEFEIIGTDSVESVEIAQDVDELEA